MACFKLIAVCLLLAIFRASLPAASEPDIDERTRLLASELRCVVCQNNSVADSPSEMAQQMRAIVREQLNSGKSMQEVRDFFVSKYGEWVLLKPKSSGVAAILWILPYVFLFIGVGAALWYLKRLSSRNHRSQFQLAQAGVATPGNFREDLSQNFHHPALEDNSPRAELLRERGRLQDEIVELEFDYQSGKISKADYDALMGNIETKGDAVLQRLKSLPSETKASSRKKTAKVNVAKVTAGRDASKRWRLIAGGAFLAFFGIAVGVMLTKSIRPRQGEGDTMTGGFMTGTTPLTSESAAAMTQGKQAFDRQDYPTAIEAFKKVLAADAAHPEAHSYMGFILMQAGHGDGALMAFEKALSRAPNFPMALWGKGMVLYQDKKDFAAAREIFERLLALVPPGQDRNEITKVLAEIPAAGGVAQSVKTAAAPAGQAISGTITIDGKVKSNLDPNAALFIIARSASGSGGPPLAVKKIDKPNFPLKYTLGQENVMMQGTPFSGKMNITVRLDKDGNPTTRGAGDLTGEYKKNPAEVGAKDADIVIDRLTQ